MQEICHGFLCAPQCPQGITANEVRLRVLTDSDRPRTQSNRLKLVSTFVVDAGCQREQLRIASINTKEGLQNSHSCHSFTTANQGLDFSHPAAPRIACLQGHTYK
jgi:hypothetical protein